MLIRQKLLVIKENVLKNKQKKFMFFLLIAFVFIFFIYSLTRNLQLRSALSDYQSFSPKDLTKNKNLLLVNQLIGLPLDKKGRVGTIKNVEALAKRHEEFKKAKNGDLVVAYQNMTIIYDPVNKTVIDIANTNLLK